MWVIRSAFFGNQIVLSNVLEQIIKTQYWLNIDCCVQLCKERFIYRCHPNLIRFLEDDHPSPFAILQIKIGYLRLHLINHQPHPWDVI